MKWTSVTCRLTAGCPSNAFDKIELVMTNSRLTDIFYKPGDALFELRMVARRHKLTLRQRWILRGRWLKNWTKFILFGPLY